MRITDINVSLGNRDAMGRMITEKEVLDMMNSYHIDHAVAYHQHALLDPKTGNQKMKEIAAASDGKLEACAVLDPILGKDNLSGEGSLVQRLKDGEFSCVRIFPDHLKMVFDSFYWEEILDAVNEIGLPLIVDEDYSKDFFVRLPEMAKQYPNIRFVLIRCGLWKGRYIFPLLTKCENVFFTAEHMLDFMQIEEIAEKAGCDRLLFGTGYPNLPVEGALGLAVYADIPEEERRKILYQNWERMRV